MLSIAKMKTTRFSKEKIPRDKGPFEFEIQIKKLIKTMKNPEKQYKVVKIKKRRKFF